MILRFVCFEENVVSLHWRCKGRLRGINWR